MTVASTKGKSTSCAQMAMARTTAALIARKRGRRARCSAAGDTERPLFVGLRVFRSVLVLLFAGEVRELGSELLFDELSDGSAGSVDRSGFLRRTRGARRGLRLGGAGSGGHRNDLVLSHGKGQPSFLAVDVGNLGFDHVSDLERHVLARVVL